MPIMFASFGRTLAGLTAALLVSVTFLTAAAGPALVSASQVATLGA